MKPKTKTASLIMQKQQNKSKQNPESYPYIPQVQQFKPINIPIDELVVKNLGLYEAFDLHFKPEKELKMEKTFSNNSNLPTEYCQLEKQNYRLIEANCRLIEGNESMLNKFSEVMEKVRSKLMGVIQNIEQFFYVEAVKAVYGLLDMIREIEDKNLNNLMEASKIAGETSKKIWRSSKNNDARNSENIEQNESHSPALFRNDSVVSSYNYVSPFKDIQSLEKAPPKIKLFSNVYQLFHVPVQYKNTDSFEYEEPESAPDFINNHLKHRSNENSFVQRNSMDNLQHDKGWRSNKDSNRNKKVYEESIRVHIEEQGEFSVFEDSYLQEEPKKMQLSERSIKIISKSGKGERQEQTLQAQAEDLYKIILSQASTLEYLLSSA